MMIELTPAQARAIAEFADREGKVSLHQLTHTKPPAAADDVYATPHGTTRGYRISADGNISEIGVTLPAED